MENNRTSKSGEELKIINEHALRIGVLNLEKIFIDVVNSLDIKEASDPHCQLTKEEVKLLQKGGVKIRKRSLSPKDPVSSGIEAYTNLLLNSMTTEDAANLLGVNKSRIRQRLTSKPPTLYAFKFNNAWKIPNFQFHGEALVPHIDKVIPHLRGELHPVTVESWFRSPNQDLVIEHDEEEKQISPLDWLIMGKDFREVVRLAEYL